MCFWWWQHSWSMWEDSPINVPVPDPKVYMIAGVYVIQSRRCYKCGKLEIRTERSNWST